MTSGMVPGTRQSVRMTYRRIVIPIPIPLPIATRIVEPIHQIANRYQIRQQPSPLRLPPAV